MVDLDYDSVKGILDSIQMYFDFLDDLMDLGFVSPDSLNNLNDFYMGKFWKDNSVCLLKLKNFGQILKK